MPELAKHESARDFRPGPIGWLRRRVFPLLARGSALLGLLILAGWITGRVLTDQHHWSQSLWWIPPIWSIASAWVLALLSLIFCKLARRPAAIFLGPVLWILTLACTIYLPVMIWNVHRVFGPDAKAPGSVRVLHWNQTSDTIDQEDWVRRIEHLDPDIVLIANAQWGTARQTLLEQFAYFAPNENQRWVNYSYRIHADPAHYRVEGSALVASRYPMTRTGMVNFGSGERQQILDQSTSGDGWVMFIELDVDPESSEDDPLVVWFVDLPSDPLRWKPEQMREVSQAVESWDGRGWSMGRHVWEQTTSQPGPFPRPDLIVGDFNTLRGSGSLSLIAPGFNDAFEAVGSGRGRSYTPPSSNAFLRGLWSSADWHIDLSLTVPGVEATRYELIGIASTPHRAQVVDFVPADR